MELIRQTKYTKEARDKTQIPIDPNVPTWAQVFFNATTDFFAANDIDKMIASSIFVQPKEN